jgi:hypothetical protein
MAIEKKSIDLIGYSHNRNSNYKTTADEIFNLINDFTDQKDLVGLYSYFEKKYQLPESVVKQKIRQHIARAYLYKKGKFESKLCIKGIPKSILQYGALIYALFFVKIKNKLKNFKLIIDDICSPHELKRFEKLLNLVGKDKVLCVTRDVDIKQEFPEYCIYNKKIFHDIDLVSLLKSIFNEFSLGIWVVFRISIKTKVNLFPVSLQIIHSYLSFKTLFESNVAQYVIQERHYNTNPIKNYLFKQAGGISSTSIQKNIFQVDPMFFYVDIDILYSLGEAGFNEFLEYGGRVREVLPVGSVFMEYYWFSNADIPSSLEKKYDVLFLGINLADRMDSYNEFLEDYYSSFKWLVRFKRENPNYRIGVIHHASLNNVDVIEAEILLNSGVEVIDKVASSYAAAFSSHCAITYGSTMGHELNAHKLPTFFIDPDYRCTFLPNERNNFLDKLRMKSYDNFSESVKAILMDNESELLTTEQKSKLCLDSSVASDRIYNSYNK